MYYSNRFSKAKKIVLRVTKAVGVASVALLIFAQTAGRQSVDISTTVCFAFVAVALIGSLRLTVYYLSRRLRRRGINTKTLLIIGGGRRSENLIKTIKSESEVGCKVLGYLDSSPGYSRRDLTDDTEWLGNFEDLERIINESVVDEVAVALPIKSFYAEIKTAIAKLEEQGIPVHLLSEFFPYRHSRVRPQEFKGLPLISLHSAPDFSWRFELKRLIDIFVASFLLVVFAALFVLIAVLIQLDSRGGIFSARNEWATTSAAFTF